MKKRKLTKKQKLEIIKLLKELRKEVAMVDAFFAEMQKEIHAIKEEMSSTKLAAVTF